MIQHKKIFKIKRNFESFMSLALVLRNCCGLQYQKKMLHIGEISYLKKLFGNTCF